MRAWRDWGLITLLLAPVPAIHYGDEVGLCAPSTEPGAAARDFDDAWPDRRPFDWTEATWDRETQDPDPRADSAAPPPACTARRQ